jgi:hypothetical protein
MNTPKPITEFVRDENKEMTIASIPESTTIQEPSGTVQPGTSPNDTNGNNDDDEVSIKRRNHNAQPHECFVVSLHFRFLTDGHD